MNLEKAMKKRRMGQVEVDDLAGLRRGTVNDILRGKNQSPSWEVVCRIARVLEVSPEELFPVSENGTAA